MTGTGPWAWILPGLFLFVLPLEEFPKNLLAAAFIAIWATQAVLRRDAGGAWDRFDTAFAAVTASAVLSAFIGGYAGDLSGAFRVLAVAWVAKRCRWTEPVQHGLLLAACAGLAVAIVAGAVPFFTGRATYLELPSVGHVNQSALYIAVLASAALGWSMQRAASPWRRRAALVAALGFGIALFITGSRAAILAYGVFVGGALLAVGIEAGASQARRLAIASALSLAMGAALVVTIGVVAPKLSGSKLQPSAWTNSESVDRRVQHWQLAFDAWQEKPWFGWGPEAFQRIDPEQVCKWRLQRSEPCDMDRYFTAPHAHSLYVSTLVERGIVGVLALATLLGAWLWELVRRSREALRSPMWMASAAAFAVTAVGGLFNTTLRVEHGSLALLLLALWLAQAPPGAGLRRPGA
ncbi:O-antigen ligase family protein [Ramlibacter sp.]|uniref:O-antigen ligase family protein n=1 Tax=Ramlibacter sp. TaxID=1917967 RepID=UPI002D6E5221|nr:O-antigen ligase family protein [Ramlibacter sp.]HYD75501.1 O-antigen ligase family protein [Ramlibacter sp.]